MDNGRLSRLGSDPTNWGVRFELIREALEGGNEAVALWLLNEAPVIPDDAIVELARMGFTVGGGEDAPFAFSGAMPKIVPLSRRGEEAPADLQPMTIEDGGGGFDEYDDDLGDGAVILVSEGGHKPKCTKPNDTKGVVGATLVTVLVHLLLGALFCLIVIQLPDGTPPVMESKLQKPVPDNPPKPKIRRNIRPATMSGPVQSRNPVVTANIHAALAVPTPEVSHDTSVEDLGAGMGLGIGIGPAGPTMIPPTFRSRCSKAERAAKREKYGGLETGDEKIKRALNYLKENQNPDGSWGDGSYDGAMTGLALLSYLGYCATPDDREYGDTVMKGILYLVEMYQNDKELYATSTNHGASYEHGIATYALGETYAIARLGNRRLPGMKEAFEHGVEVIIEGQNPDGGWSYGYPARGQSDTSVTGWQFQALKAAKHTKLRISGLDRAIRQAQYYLEDVQDRSNGMFPYRPSMPGKATLTGAGVLGLQMLGVKDYKREIEMGLESIVAGTKGKNWGNANLYEWYYNTQATFEAGGEAWRTWNAMFQSQIIDNQRADGGWSHGSARQGGDDIYATCLCTLMLEVYYRYLPAAQQ